MGSVPVFTKNPYEANQVTQVTTQIDRIIGSSYDTVRFVAENIEYIKHVSAHLAQIYRVYQSIDGIDAIYANIENLEILLEHLDQVIAVAESIDAVDLVADNIDAVNDVSANMAFLLELHANLPAILAHGPSSVIVADEAPLEPLMQGQMWWSSKTGNLQAWYIDQDSAQWVQINTDSSGGANNRLTPQLFGAVGDGVTDDGAALLAWYDAMVNTGAAGVIPKGRYAFASPLVFPSADYISITGDAQYGSELVYIGANTSVDCITFGDGTNDLVGWSISGLHVSSNTVMTGGCGVIFKLLGRSTISIVVEGQDRPRNFWHGLWFDGVGKVVVPFIEATAKSGDVVRVNGRIGGGYQADLHLLSGWIGGSNGVGLRMGGAFGGLFLDSVTLANNSVNMVIDTTLAAEGNREFFASSLAVFDITRNVANGGTGLGPNIDIADTLTSTFWCQFNGSWIAGSQGHGVHIRAGVRGLYHFHGGTFFNNLGDGIHVDSTDLNCNVDIYGTFIRASGGYGVNTVANTSVRVRDIRTGGNALGDVNGTEIRYHTNATGLSVGRAAVASGAALHVTSAYGEGDPSYATGTGMVYQRNSAAGQAARFAITAGTTGIAGIDLGDKDVSSEAGFLYTNGTQVLAIKAPAAGSITLGAKTTAPAATTAAASLNVPHGAAPTTPANGDIWTTTAGLFVRINGTTVGPLT